MSNISITRRRLLQYSAASVAAPLAFQPRLAFAEGETIKIGYISPRSGALSGISESDGYVLDRVRAALGGKLETATGAHAIEIIDKDTRSSWSIRVAIPT